MNNIYTIMGNIVSPNTGDEDFPVLMIIAILLALAGIIYLLVTRKKR